MHRWWSDSRTPEQARELALLLPRLFLQYFARTSLIATDPADDRPVGFLVGFHSGDNDADAYIHFVGVDPARRGTGLGRRLYREFFARAVRAGRRRVAAITSPANAGSMAFHRAMGFTIVDSGGPDPLVHKDYDGPGQDRVCFTLDLS